MKIFAQQRIYWAIDCYRWRDQWFWLRLLNVEIVFFRPIQCSPQFSRCWTSRLFEKNFQIFNCLFCEEKLPQVEFFYFQIQFRKGTNSTIWHLNWARHISSIPWCWLCSYLLSCHCLRCFCSQSDKDVMVMQVWIMWDKRTMQWSTLQCLTLTSFHDIVTYDAIYLTCSVTSTNGVQADWWAVEFCQFTSISNGAQNGTWYHNAQSFQPTLLKLRW